MRAITQLALAFGPKPHVHGYFQHNATRSKTQSDSLKRLLRKR